MHYVQYKTLNEMNEPSVLKWYIIGKTIFRAIKRSNIFILLLDRFENEHIWYFKETNVETFTLRKMKEE